MGGVGIKGHPFFYFGFITLCHTCRIHVLELKIPLHTARYHQNILISWIPILNSDHICSEV